MDRPAGEEARSRIARLLEHNEPDSTDYALARFAVESVVASMPAATFEEHEVFVDEKMQEALRAEDAMDWLAALDRVAEGPAKAAADALRRAQFDDADAALAELEDSRAAADPANTRICLSAREARAKAALVRGDAVAAAEHFVCAARHVPEEREEPYDHEDAMMFRSRAVGELILHAETFGGDGGWIDDAMKLCGQNIRYRHTHVWNQGAHQMDAGAAQLTAGRLKGTAEALDLFLRAEYAFRIASWHFDKGGFPVDWAAATNAQGIAQAQFAYRYPETGKPCTSGMWAAPEDCYRAAMEVREAAGQSLQWAKTRINFGYLLLNRGRAEEGADGREFLHKAVEECLGAQEALRPELEPEVWADAQLIAIEAMLDHAEIDTDDAMTHISRARIELTKARNFMANERLPLMMARADRLIARLQRDIEVLGDG